ncbi:mitochondrial protein Pet127-domain-containing protein [Phaeosphaeriaceae sp. PMI808]|nr:mitochondrial protein Pet127-domain-containing protein [Phaeosphaeriaceae sp. PMI808]
MLRRNLLQASPWRNRSVCLFCAARTQPQPSQVRAFSTTSSVLARTKVTRRKGKTKDEERETIISLVPSGPSEGYVAKPRTKTKKAKRIAKEAKSTTTEAESTAEEVKITTNEGGNTTEEVKGTTTKAIKITKVLKDKTPKLRKTLIRTIAVSGKPEKDTTRRRKEIPRLGKASAKPPAINVAKEAYKPMSLKEALIGKGRSEKAKKKREEMLQIEIIEGNDLDFEPVPLDIPPVPMLSYGLDRVLFNPGVYRLQDPRSRLYNFDPYLEKIMPVHEFDFDALSEYKTSSKDQTLLDLTKSLGTKFTGSTSSMSSVLQHFHYLLSNFRALNHNMLSRAFPEPSKNFSKITLGPDAIFLRYKDGIYAIDADKSYDKPNIMSWLGHSLEKLLTTDRSEFELFRRSNPEEAPAEDNSSRCYHYSKLGNILMRSQLDAHDPRLPGTGVFDLKTRAVVSIRMNHKEYEKGSGYQLRFAQGEWESYEREFYDMTRATLLKYSLQVRMGRMDGIFLAFHNIERIFGFQYLSLPDLDKVLHGQEDTTLGDQEFKLSIRLLDELLTKATEKFPETSIRLHFETRETTTPFMYIFAEPVSEEQADEIQGSGEAAQKDFARTVVGVGKDNPEVQAAWQSIQDEVDEHVDEDKQASADAETAETPVQETTETEVTENEVTEPEEEPSQNAEDQVGEVTATPDTPVAKNGPLMGWTLSVRSKVNETYVDRPVNITEEDNWKLEYHVQEISEASCWRLYNALKERRRALIGMEDEEVNKGLENYRNLIQRFSNRGREWRDEQDKVDKEKGVHLYRPMGPGADEVW